MKELFNIQMVVDDKHIAEVMSLITELYKFAEVNSLNIYKLEESVAEKLNKKAETAKSQDTSVDLKISTHTIGQDLAKDQPIEDVTKSEEPINLSNKPIKERKASKKKDVQQQPLEQPTNDVVITDKKDDNVVTDFDFNLEQKPEEIKKPEITSVPFGEVESNVPIINSVEIVIDKTTKKTDVKKVDKPVEKPVEVPAAKLEVKPQKPADVPVANAEVPTVDFGDLFP